MTEMSEMSPPSPVYEKLSELKRRALKRRALTALREHGTISHAAAAAGVAVRTLQRWREDDPEFAAEITEWMHVDQVAELHQSLYQIAMNPTEKTASASVKAGEFLLKSLERATYGDQLTTNATININHSVELINNHRDELRAAQAQRLRELEARTIDAQPVSKETI